MKPPQRLCLALLAAAAQAGPVVEHSVVDAGGGWSVSRRFTLVSSLGGPSGVQYRGPHQLRSGFAGQLNDPPQPGRDTFLNLPLTQDFLIPSAALLANDTDAEGDPLMITTVSTPSAAGAFLSVLRSALVYQPGSAPAAADEFVYEVEDGFGGRAWATVRLHHGLTDPALWSNRVGPPLVLSDGSRQITFAGLPERHYAIQFADELGTPLTWTDLGCGSTGADGLVSVVDLGPGGATRFYRAVELAIPCAR